MRFIDATGSKSIITNFMMNAGRNTCNAYLFEALKDAIEALDRHEDKEIDTKFGGRLYGSCPACGRMYQDKGHIHNYCDRCGQRLVLPVETEN